MKKIYFKLIAITLTLAVSFSVVVMSSYAWFTLANNPVANGLQIAIGGGHTILLAPDLTKEIDGVVYHYPGEFESTLDLNGQESYAYLKEVKALIPVSTADGRNWFIPQYYDLLDAQVKDGSILTGTLKSEQDFILDDRLAYANRTDGEEDALLEGNYLYFDFWVVSPAEGYTLRVSMGDNSGTYVIGLPYAAEDENGELTLVELENDASAGIRAGFLVNSDTIADETYTIYQQSSAYSDNYHKLHGIYTEPGEETAPSSEYRFTIYEPNGDYHPHTDAVTDGDYIKTSPLGLQNGEVAHIDIQDILTVQKRSLWAAAEVGEGTQLEQRFQTALFEPSFQELTAEEAAERFYHTYLGGQLAPYVKEGRFVKETETLYSTANEDGITDSMFLEDVFIAGATDDVYIVTLQKNVPQRIRLFLWVEGEDVDCTRMADTSNLMISLELAGSNAYG